MATGNQSRGVNFLVDKIAYLNCGTCGAKISVDSAMVKCHEEDGALVIQYDEAYTKIVLINAQSGARRTVDIPGGQTPTPPSRHIGGIIGPY